MPVPESIVALWEPGYTQVYFLIGDKQVGSVTTLAGSHLVFKTQRAMDVDRLLLIGGTRSRWAERTSDGSFAWASTGYVIAGRLPEDLGEDWEGWPRPIRCLVDLLGAADSRARTNWVNIFPAALGYPSNDERIVIGVPGPGAWTAVICQDGGGGELLVTANAIREESIPLELPTFSVRRGDYVARFDDSRVTPVVGGMANVQMLADVGWSGWRNALRPGSESTLIDVRVPALNMAGTTWFWSAGWETQHVDGRKLTTSEWIVSRSVQPGCTLEVRTVDAQGRPVADASVVLQDTTGNDVPAAWSRPANNDELKLWWWGKSSPVGLSKAHGLPVELVTSLRVSAEGWKTAVVEAPWRVAHPTAGPESSLSRWLEVVLEQDE
ncbi:MAG: hypothetical protein ACT4PU_08395 [Planctomycetota bacterium]